ncbi:MAG: carboxypeptidase-like regulatory domain-containing protein [Bacillota bacterium]
MENGFDKLDIDQTGIQDKEAESFKIVSFVNRDILVTRSAKVTIKFPPENADNDDDCTDENKTDENIDENNTEEACPPDTDVLPDYTGDIQNNNLLFQGVVRDGNNKALEGAAVMVFACYKGGTEKPLGYSFTGEDGTYIVNIPAPPDYKRLEGYKVRAGKGTLPPDGGGRTADYGEKSPTKPANRGFYDFLRMVSGKPNKTISELMKEF